MRLDAGDALDATADGVDAPLEENTYACDETRAIGGARGSSAILRETLLPPADDVLDFDAAEAIRAAMRESKSASVAARRVAARRSRGRAVVPGDGVERWTIHGGTSGIGIAACAWLDARDVRDITLVGRSGRTRRPKSPAKRAATAAAFDPRRETAVTMRRADVSTAEESATTRRPREGIVHASGVLSDASLARLTAGATRVFAGTESAGRVVAASRRDVRAFLFSAARRRRFPGTGNDAAVNADMDARRERTRAPSVAIRWGAGGYR